MTQCALIYCRVSSKRQTTDGSGLSSQQKRCEDYAAQQGYIVEQVFPDDITGGGNFTKRKGMVALLEHINANPDTSYVVIFDDLKRLARDTKYYLILRETLDALDVRVECLNFTFQDTPEGEFFETVIMAGGQMERKQGARQVRQKIIARFEAGYWGTNAPIGYKMQNERGKERILVRDEPIASYVQEALESFACGRFETQAEVGRFLAGCPEFPKTSKHGIHTDTIKNLLTKSVYAGLVELKAWGVVPRKGHHEALISVEDFQKIQERLVSKPKAPIRKNMAREFPLRGAVCCADCNMPYYSTFSKGRSKRYPYYVCMQKGCDSYGKSVRREDMESAFDELLIDLTPSKNVVVSFGKMFKTQWIEMGKQLEKNKYALEAKAKELETQKTKTIDKLLETTHAAVVKAAEQRLTEIDLELAVTQEKIGNCGRPFGDFEENFRTALDFLANPRELWASGLYEHKRALLKLGFSEPLLYHRKEGFRTACKSSPFRLIDDLSNNRTRMVDATGLEPVTLAL
jgi:DNA invertase Pin-like site-specific DNA recombinase